MKPVDDDRLDRVKKIGFLVSQAFAAVVVIIISTVGHLDRPTSLLALVIFLMLMGIFTWGSYRRIARGGQGATCSQCRHHDCTRRGG